MVARLNRSTVARVPALALLAGPLLVGATWGVAARVWMRMITSDPEFTWSGTLYIVGASGLAFTAQVGPALARRRQRGRLVTGATWVLAIAALLPMGAGAGFVGLPVLLIVPLVAGVMDARSLSRVVPVGLVVVGATWPLVVFGADDLEGYATLVGMGGFIALYATAAFGIASARSLGRIDIDRLGQLYLAAEVAVVQGDQLVPATEAEWMGSRVVHVITGWNPGGRTQSVRRNEAADRRLHQELVDRGLEPVRARGSDPRSAHYEDSWAVVGLTDDLARAIGNRFGQVAVFRLADGVQTVVGCTGRWQMSRSLDGASSVGDLPR